MANQITVEEVRVPVKHLLDQGIIYASSPLLREPSPTHLVQVVKRRDGSFYSLEYQRPIAEEINEKGSE